MDLHTLQPLARRLIKSAIRRHTYGEKVEPGFVRLSGMEEDLYSEALSEWSRALEGEALPPEDRAAIIEMLQMELLVAKQSIASMFRNVGIDGQREIEAYVGGFNPEAFLPGAGKS